MWSPHCLVNICYHALLGFLGGAMVKNLLTNAGDIEDVGLIPGSGRSSGEGNGNSLQYSCLGNPMDRRAFWATVHGIAKNQTWLRTYTTYIVRILFLLWVLWTCRAWTLPCLLGTAHPALHQLPHVQFDCNLAVAVSHKGILRIRNQVSLKNLVSYLHIQLLWASLGGWG